MVRSHFLSQAHPPIARSPIAHFTYFILLVQWLPRFLFQVRTLLFTTHRLLPKSVWETKDALVRIAEDLTRGIIGNLRVAGKSILENYNSWITDAIETAEQQPEGAIDMSPSFQQLIGGREAESAGRHPEMQQQHHTGALGPEGSRSLRAVCAYYMRRNGSLERLNESLVRQVDKLEGDLHEARTNLFHAQQIIARLKEVEDVRANRLRVRQSVYLTLSQREPRFAERESQVSGSAAPGAPPPLRSHSLPARRAETADKPAHDVPNDLEDSFPDSDMDDDDNAQGDNGDLRETSDLGSRSPQSSDVSDPPSDVDFDDEDDQSFDERTISDSPVAAHEASDPAHQSSAGTTSSYRQLTELNSGEDDGNWHRHALRQLARERELRARNRSSSPRQQSRPSLPSQLEVAELQHEESRYPASYQMLATLRSAVPDEEVPGWQRQALHYLTQERRRLACYRFSASSASPTNSSTSTLTFAYDD